MTRRRDSRLEIANTEGVLRVLRDVTVNRTDDGDFIVIGSEAGTLPARSSRYRSPPMAIDPFWFV